MKFGPVPIELAVDKILGHNIAGADGRRVFRKGRALTAADVERLRALGRAVVYVAELEAGDVGENEAARRVTSAVMGRGLYVTGPSTGRTNLKAEARGIFRVDARRLARLNAAPGITLATLATHTAVAAGQIVATVKIIPYAVPETAVAAVEAVAREDGPLLAVAQLPPRAVHIILSGSPSAEASIVRSFEPPLRQRLEALGAAVASITYIPLEDEAGEMALAYTLRAQAAAGAGLIILAGETAIMDRYDIAPRAIERAGGAITCFGAPVDPGNLLLLAALDDVPILGAPGCARSPKANIIDQVLPRLLAGDRLTQADIVALGHGGLLEDVPERPYPRSRVYGER